MGMQEAARGNAIQSLVAMPTNKRMDFFNGFSKFFSQMLRSDNPERDATRVVALAVQLTSDPRIAKCKPKTIVGAIAHSLMLGFDPIPSLGLAAFIPYGDSLHFQIEYKGYLQLLYNTGLYETIYAEVVREGDEFDYQMGLHPDITHRPKAPIDARLTHVYAVAWAKGSSRPQFRVMDRSEVMQIRDHYSQAYKSGKKDSPWFGLREPEMWKKTALLQLQKYLQKSTTVMKAAAIDEKAVNYEDIDPKTGESKYEFTNIEVAEYTSQGEGSHVSSGEGAPSDESPSGTIGTNNEQNVENEKKRAKDEAAPAPAEPKKPKTPDDPPDPPSTLEWPRRIRMAYSNAGITSIAAQNEMALEIGIKDIKAATKIEFDGVVKQLRKMEQTGKNEPENPMGIYEDEVAAAAAAAGIELPQRDPSTKDMFDDSEKGVEDDLNKPLIEVMEQSQANRKIKYIREKFREAGDAMLTAGYKNLGEFCQEWDIPGLTTKLVTLGMYEEMKEQIKQAVATHGV